MEEPPGCIIPGHCLQTNIWWGDWQGSFSTCRVWLKHFYFQRPSCLQYAHYSSPKGVTFLPGQLNPRDLTYVHLFSSTNSFLCPGKDWSWPRAVERNILCCLMSHYFCLFWIWLWLLSILKAILAYWNIGIPNSLSTLCSMFFSCIKGTLTDRGYIKQSHVTSVFRVNVRKLT